MGWYWLTPGPAKAGDLVLLRNPLKRLVGRPGDTITTTPEGSYVNGRLVPNSGIPVGSPYPHYPYGTFKLQPYQVWMLADNPLSFDSRYVGSWPDSFVIGKVNPLWTK